MVPMNDPTPASGEDPAATRSSLIRRLHDGDDQAGWQEFFDTYWKLIFAVATKAGLSDAEARDVVQETAVSVAQSLQTGQYDRARGSSICMRSRACRCSGPRKSRRDRQ